MVHDLYATSDADLLTLYNWSVSLVATPDKPDLNYGMSRSFAMQIAHVAFSFAFAILGGLTGAYWSKPKTSA
jgi:hypothetical protein